MKGSDDELDRLLRRTIACICSTEDFENHEVYCQKRYDKIISTIVQRLDDAKKEGFFLAAGVLGLDSLEKVENLWSLSYPYIKDKSKEEEKYV